MGGIFCLEYPSRRTEKVNCHFVNYKLSFRKLHIFISQTTDFHFANYRFSFRKLQILISQTTDFKPNHPFFSILAFTTPVHFPLCIFRIFFTVIYSTKLDQLPHAVTDCLLFFIGKLNLPPLKKINPSTFLSLSS